MASGVESDPLIWKIITGVFLTLSGVLTYFIKKRDEKIDKNVDALNDLKTEVVSIKAHAEMSAAEQREMKETLMGLTECMNDVRIYLAGLPCKRDPSCGITDRRSKLD